MPSVLTLAAAKTHLNLSAATTHDVELQAFIDRAEAALSHHVGPLQAAATTARVLGGAYTLTLPTAPAISLTSVTPVDGSALVVGDLNLDAASGVVTYNSGAGFSARYYTVVYSAGRTTCPADLLLAVAELVRHMWVTQRGSSNRPGSPIAEAVPGAAHSLPFRVTELIAPHVQHGFA